MAKILVCYYHPIIEEDASKTFCFYDSLSIELKNHGNDVLLFNLSGCKVDAVGEEIKDKNLIHTQIREFSPDLAIAFNNQIFEGIFDVVDCPVACWDADSLDKFACKDFLKRNIEKYTMITSYEGFINDYINFGFNKKNVHYIPLATSVRKENLIPDKNISIIGTSFDHDHSIQEQLDKDNNLQLLSKVFLEFIQNPDYDYVKLFNKVSGYDTGKSSCEVEMLFDLRELVLINLIDLGLNIYGAKFAKFKKIIPQLYWAYDKTPKYSLKHNQGIYNSSKINLSINHPQCVGVAFPWRCFDIMASNGVLVSGYSKQLQELTKICVDIPMYNTPAEARVQCLRLLNNENMRKDIVCASQDFVDKNCRWEYRFKDLENIFNINLLNQEGKGSINFVNYKLNDYRKKTFKLKTKLGKRCMLDLKLKMW